MEMEITFERAQELLDMPDHELQREENLNDVYDALWTLVQLMAERQETQPPQ